MGNLYCFVDETGQDPGSELFIVAIVLSADDVNELRNLVERIESETKGKTKWIKTKHALRIAFWERVTSSNVPMGTVAVCSYRDKTDFFEKTVDATVRAVGVSPYGSRETVIVVDGLPKSAYHRVGTLLRKHGVAVRKIRGEREEGEALLRLADMTAGLARGANEGGEAYQQLYQRLVDRAVIREIKNPHG